MTSVCTEYDPDIEPPLTDPEYVITSEPSVPNLIAFPSTVPVIGSVSDGADNWIVPLNDEPDCCQCSKNVPSYDPLYCPFHVPEIPLASAAMVVAATVVTATVAPATGAEDVPAWTAPVCAGTVPPPLELHAAVPASTTSPTADANGSILTARRDNHM